MASWYVKVEVARIKPSTAKSPYFSIKIFYFFLSCSFSCRKKQQTADFNFKFYDLNFNFVIILYAMPLQLTNGPNGTSKSGIFKVMACFG